MRVARKKCHWWNRKTNSRRDFRKSPVEIQGGFNFVWPVFPGKPSCKRGYPSKHEVLTTVVLMLARRLRRRPNSKTTVDQSLVFAGDMYARDEWLSGQPISPVINTCPLLDGSSWWASTGPVWANAGPPCFFNLWNGSDAVWTRRWFHNWVDLSIKGQTAIEIPSNRATGASLEIVS